MKCPVCGRPLEEERTSSYRIYNCNSCQGSWFDPGELISYTKVRGAQKAPVYQDFSSLLNTNTYVREDPGEDFRNCPRCHSPLQKSNYAYNSNIMVDKCPECEGVWLDNGEFPVVARFLDGSEIFRERGYSLSENLAAPESSPSHLPLWLSGALAVIYIILAMSYLGGLLGFAEGVFRMAFPIAFIWGPALMGDDWSTASPSARGGAYPFQGLHRAIFQLAGWILLAYSVWKLWWAWTNGLSSLGRF